jgi:hypothetical protein
MSRSEWKKNRYERRSRIQYVAQFTYRMNNMSVSNNKKVEAIEVPVEKTS